MALTVLNAYDYARAFLKVPSGYLASADQLRTANTVQSIISSFHTWHWNITAGTDIAVSAATQTYTMNAANQNAVLRIVQANLLEGSTEQPELYIWSDPPVPLTTTQGQPYALSLINPTQLRIYPNADASYTLQWRYYKRPVIFAATSESWDIPEAFTESAKAGMVWQLSSIADDTRAAEYQKIFYELLANHKRVEQLSMGRHRG